MPQPTHTQFFEHQLPLQEEELERGLTEALGGGNAALEALCALGWGLTAGRLKGLRSD